MSDHIDEMVDDLLANFPLKEQVLIANMDEIDIVVLQKALGRYLKALAGEGIEEDLVIMRMWERLRQTHTIRVV